MTEVDTVLEAITLGSTAVALLLFLARTGVRAQPGPETETDFGVVFGAFLAAWLATEVLHVFAVPPLLDWGNAIHFLLLLALAAWLNARFYNALRRAKEGEA